MVRHLLRQFSHLTPLGIMNLIIWIISMVSSLVRLKIVQSCVDCRVDSS